jgi:TonB-dependent siderophore receptor
MSRKAILLASSILASTANSVFAQQLSDAEVNLDEIVVTGTRIERTILETPASISVQNMEALYDRGFFSSPDELRGVPGVFFRRGEGDNDDFPSVTIRGVTGNHGNDTFLTLVDGIPFISANEEVLLNQVPFGALDRIEIVRGPVSALYGRGGISGAINYITKSPQTDATTLTLSGGSNGYYRAGGTLERSFDRARVLADVNYENAEGWRDSNARRILNTFVKGEFDLTDNTTVTGYFNYGDRRNQVGSAIPTFPDGRPADVIGGRTSDLTFGDTFNENETVMGALRVNHQFNDSLSIQVTGHARRIVSGNLLNFYDPSLFDGANNIFGVNGYEGSGRSNVGFVEATVNWTIGPNTIVAGLNAERVRHKSQEFWTGQYGFTFACGFQFYAVRINYRTGQVVNANHPCFVRNQMADTDTTNKFWSAFLQDEIAITDQLTLTLGGRFDNFERDTLFKPVFAGDTSRTLTDSKSAFSPKAALSYDLNGTSIYFAYGRGFSSNFGPTWQWDASQYERSSRPTTLDSYEIGAKGRTLDDRFTYTLAAFYLQQKNRAIIINNPDPAGPPNLSTTGELYSSRGIEATAAYRLLDATTLSASYTYMKPKWDDYEAAGLVLTGFTPTGVPEHMGFIEVAHQFTDMIGVKASWEIYGDYFITQNNSQKGGAYNLLNASVSVALPFTQRTEINLGVTNLLDKEYDFIFGGHSGGRNVVTHRVPGVPRQFRAILRTTF